LKKFQIIFRERSLYAVAHLSSVCL